MIEKLFPRNEGTLDRALRVSAGLVLLSLAFVGPKTPWGFVGLIFVATGLVGSCPMYTVFGMKTCKSQTSLP